MIMPAYAAMLLHINYAQIYASIIRQGLSILTAQDEKNKQNTQNTPTQITTHTHTTDDLLKDETSWQCAD